MNNGWIKIHRSILKWGWYDDLPTFRLFLHLLLTANHEDKEWHNITIERGQTVCSMGKLAKESGLSFQQVRTALDKLQKTGEINKQTTSQYTIITVVNYHKYQIEQQTNNKPSTNHQQTNNKQNQKNQQTTVDTLQSSFAENIEDEQQAANKQNQQIATTNKNKELKNLKDKDNAPAREGKYFLSLDDCFGIIKSLTASKRVQEAASEWARMRYAKRKESRLTEKAIQKAFQKIKGWGYGESRAAKCFEQSVENLWNGVFELKE